MKKPGSRKRTLLAIQLKCLECMGWNRNPKSRKPYKAVKECPDTECPLSPYREGVDTLHPAKRRKRSLDNLKPLSFHRDEIQENETTIDDRI